MLPRSTDPAKVNRHGFVLVGIELEGRLTCEQVRPTLIPGAYRAFALGLQDMRRIIAPNYAHSVRLDDALFPDARRYLANTLPKIADHLTLCASWTK